MDAHRGGHVAILDAVDKPLQFQGLRVFSRPGHERQRSSHGRGHKKSEAGAVLYIDSNSGILFAWAAPVNAGGGGFKQGF